MSTTVARLEAILTANTRDFEQGMDRSHSKFGKVSKAAGVAGLAIAGGLAVGLEKSVKAAMDAQVSQARLETAFKTSGLRAGAYSKQIDALEQSGRKLGFSDEEVKNSLGSLIIATHSMSKASKDLSVAQDIARFKHIDLESATKMLTMAQAGSQRATKQLGLTVQASTANYQKAKLAHDAATYALQKQFGALKTGTKAQQDHYQALKISTDQTWKGNAAVAKQLDKQVTAAKVIALVTEKLHGQSDAYAKTAAGSMEQYHAQLDHLQVTIGEALMPAMVAITGEAAKMTGWLSQHPGLVKALVIGLGILAGALMAASVAQHLMNLAVLANPYVLAIVAIVAIGVAVYIFRDKLMNVYTWIKDHWPLLAAILAGPIALAAFEIARHWDDIVNGAKKMAAEVFSAITRGLTGIGNAAWGILNNIGEVIANKAEAIVGWGDKIANQIKNAVVGTLVGIGNAAWDIVNNIGDVITKKLDAITGWGASVGRSVLHGITGALSDGLKAVKNAVEDLFGKVIGWVKDVLGIGSPSAVFHEIGRNVIKGFVNGVGSMGGVLKDAVVGMAKGLPGAVAGAVGGALGGGSLPPGTGTANENLARGLAYSQYNWRGPDWTALFNLWTRESGFNQFAKNASSGAYGIPQALPATKMPPAAREAGGSDPRSQILWGLQYIKDRYGSPSAAWAHEQNVGWYDQGGWLPKGLSLALNTTGAPERVGGGDVVIPVSIGGSTVATVIWDQLRNKAQVFEQQNGRPAF